jgi:RNA polymerase sigma-70 factor (ECF subfamily)
MTTNNSQFNIAIELSVITRAQKGDLTAHEEFFKLFSKPVYNLALRLCNQKELAEDVLQNTFLKIINGIGSFQCQAPFGMWLRKVAINESLMLLRKNKQLPNFVSFENSDEFNNVIEFDLQEKSNNCEIHHYQVRSTLEKTLAQLPAQTRVVLLLKEVEGYSHQEIAELMGKSESYSKSLLSRAFKRLTDCFAVTSKKPIDDRNTPEQEGI